MKYLKHALLLAATLCVGTCVTITPDQAASYAATAHTVVGNGLADYKTIKPLTK